VEFGSLIKHSYFAHYGNIRQHFPSMKRLFFACGGAMLSQYVKFKYGHCILWSSTSRGGVPDCGYMTQSVQCTNNGGILETNLFLLKFSGQSTPPGWEGHPQELC